MRTRPVSAAQVRAYTDKAAEYAADAVCEKELRRLLPLKTKAEYEPDAVESRVSRPTRSRMKGQVAHRGGSHALWLE